MPYAIKAKGPIKYRPPPEFISMYMPDPLTWVDTGAIAPNDVNYSTIIRIGTTLYSFGGIYGSIHNKIYRSSYSDGLNWTDSGGTLPEVAYSPHIILLGSNLYMFGSGNGAVTKIYTATTSDPLSWTYTGANLPYRRDNAPIAIVGDKIVIFHGYYGGGSNKIFVADKSTPLSWSEVTVTNALWNWENGVFIMDGTAYVVGGDIGGRTSVERYSSDLTSCTLLSYVLPYQVSHVPICIDIGTKAYIIGGFDGNNTVQYSEFAGSPPSPGSVWSYSNVLPSDMRYRSDMMWISADGYMYTINYSDRRIFRTGRTEVIVQKPNPNDSSSLPAVFASDGTPTVLTRSCRLGFKSWLTDRTDMILS